MYCQGHWSVLCCIDLCYITKPCTALHQSLECLFPQRVSDSRDSSQLTSLLSSHCIVILTMGVFIFLKSLNDPEMRFVWNTFFFCTWRFANKKLIFLLIFHNKTNFTRNRVSHITFILPVGAIWAHMAGFYCQNIYL